MTPTVYPELIETLPDIDLDLAGVRGKLLQAEGRQVVFFDFQPKAVIPPHSHRSQWGIMVEGEMDLTIGGRTRTYRKGDNYFIPAGVEHSASFRTRVKAIDFFDDPERYRPKKR